MFDVCIIILAAFKVVQSINYNDVIVWKIIRIKNSLFEIIKNIFLFTFILFLGTMSWLILLSKFLNITIL